VKANPTAAVRLRHMYDALESAYGRQHWWPVADEYLRRIAVRHGLMNDAPGRGGYESLVELTRKAFADDPPARHARLFNEMHALAVAVGKAHCGRAPVCTGCPLAGDLELANARPSGKSMRVRRDVST
jgi:endonuclease-3 related protein